MNVRISSAGESLATRNSRILREEKKKGKDNTVYNCRGLPDHDRSVKLLAEFAV